MTRIEVTSTEVQRDWSRIQAHLDEGGEVVVVRYSRRKYLITSYPEEPIVSTTTTDYGSWHNLMGGSTLTITDYVREALDDESDYDVEAIVAEFRDEINNVLPDDVTLHGEGQLYGPHPMPQDWDDTRLDIREEIEHIDFWGIVARHEVLGKR